MGAGKAGAMRAPSHAPDQLCKVLCTLSARVYTRQCIHERHRVTLLLSRWMLWVLGCKGVQKGPRGTTKLFLGHRVRRGAR